MFGLFKRRNIFRFHDGRRRRRVDPWQAFRRLVAHPQFAWQEHANIVFGDSLPEGAMAEEAYHEAVDITVAAVREIFGIVPVEDGGLTDMETLAVLADFEGFCAALKKKHAPSVTSLSPTGSASSGGSPTKSGSASGSTSNGLNSVDPLPLHPG